VAIEVFGVTRGNKREPKDTWWWNDEVQKAINEKNECYKRLHHNKSDENIQKYKEARRNAKKVVSEAKSQTYTELYQKYREIERVCTLKRLTDKRKGGLLVMNRRRVNKAQKFKYYKSSPLLISHACSRANNKNLKQ
jgi:hypothetical protein